MGYKLKFLLSCRVKKSMLKAWYMHCANKIFFSEFFFFESFFSSQFLLRCQNCCWENQLTSISRKIVSLKMYLNSYPFLEGFITCSIIYLINKSGFLSLLIPMTMTISLIH